MTAMIEDDFELELRSMPGVVNVGIGHDGRGEVRTVTVVARRQSAEAVQESAQHVTSLYYPDAEVTVESVDDTASIAGAGRARIALVQADFDERDGSCELHLGHEGRIGVGRAASGPLIGGAEATLAALRDLGLAIPFYLLGVSKVDIATGWSVVVTLRPHAGEDDRVGIARAEGDLVAAARATLSALNRYVTMEAD